MRFYLDTRIDKAVETPGLDSELTEEQEFKHSPIQRLEFQWGQSPDSIGTQGLNASNTWTKELRGLNTSFTTDFGTDSEQLILADATYFRDNDEVYIVPETDGILPTPLVIDVFYFVVNKSGSNIELAATSGGAPITLTADATAPCRIYRKPAILTGLKADTEYDGLALASETDFELDTANYLYRLNLDLTTKQIRSLLGRDDPGDGTTFTTDFGVDSTLTLTTPAEVSAGDRVGLTNSGGALPAPLEAGCDYYWLATDELSLTAGGAAIALTDDGTGTHTLTRQPDVSNDVEYLESLEFEIQWQDDTDLVKWRTHINPLTGKVWNSVFDGTEAEPASGASPAVSLIFTGTIASGVKTGTIAFSPALASTPAYVLLTGYQPNDEAPVTIGVDPGTLSASGVDARASSASHTGVNVTVQVIL